jgi:Spy/CpxP family protein refolding chaperone
MAFGRRKESSSRHPPSLENDMKKLAAALIASLFATVAFAQTPAPAATTPAPAAAPKVHKHKVKHHKIKAQPAKAASGA